MYSEPNYNAKDFLTELEQEGHIKNRSSIERHLLSDNQEEDLPGYLKLLSAVGTFLAAFFFVSMVTILFQINPYSAHSVPTGLLIGVLAFGLRAISVGDLPTLQEARRAKEKDPMTEFIFRQASTSLLWLGKMFIVVGTLNVMDTAWGVPISLGVLTPITCVFYPSSSNRICSSLAFLVSLQLVVLTATDGPFRKNMGYLILFLGQVVGFIFLRLHHFEQKWFKPLIRILTCSLCSSVLLIVIPFPMGLLETSQVMVRGMTVIIAAALLLDIGYLSNWFRRPERFSYILATGGVLLLAAISAPGILLTIGFLLLGYERRDRFFLSAGGCLLPVFLFLYYYSMETSLLKKSWILMASGAVLLLGGAYVNWRKESWNRILTTEQ